MLNAGQTYCRMLKGAFCNTFDLSLSFHLSLLLLFYFFLSGCFTQVLLYIKGSITINVGVSLSRGVVDFLILNHAILGCDKR